MLNHILTKMYNIIYQYIIFNKMLKKIKINISRPQTFCHIGKRWYFCTRFRSKVCERDNVKKQ
jgi:hypothetical protein